MKLKFLGSKVTTDAGLFAYHVLDETFALTEVVQDRFEDSEEKHWLLFRPKRIDYRRYRGANFYQLSIGPSILAVLQGFFRLPGGRNPTAFVRTV